MLSALLYIYHERTVGWSWGTLEVEKRDKEKPIVPW